MPREPRSFVPGVVYHLISRMVDREWFIQSDEERRTYFRLLARALTESDWKLLAYAVMSNHIHFAAMAGEHLLDSWVRRVHAPFAGWMNRTHDRIGTVFVRGPKDHNVAPTEVARVIAYIHNNPVRAGVVKAARASDWTSHRAYVGLEARPWLHVEDGLRLSGFQCGGQFDEWVRSAHANRSRDPLFEQLEARTAYEIVEGEIVEVIPQPALLRIDPSRLVEVTAASVGISIDQLCSRGRGAQQLAARSIVVHAGRRLGLTGSAVARALGMTHQAVSAIGIRTSPVRVVDGIVDELRAEARS